jgi:hypothetical protein
MVSMQQASLDHSGRINLQEADGLVAIMTGGLL